MDRSEVVALIQQEMQKSQLASLVRQLQGRGSLHSVGAAGEPAFLNGWGNLGIGEPAVAFYKQGGHVFLLGAASAGAVNTAIFQLPMGYRPAALMYFPAVIPAGVAYASVDAAGNVIGGAGSNAGNRLNGIFFRVA